MAVTIQVRVDDDLKEKSDKLFKELGTDTTTAVRMFLKKAVDYNGFPFEIRKTEKADDPFELLTGEQIQKKLEISRLHAEQGNLRSAEEVIADMRGRYGL